jgi:glycosyltransferase involved in cell wall biosynthesis
MRLPVTVCMATFNGALYLKEQIDSILTQLNTGDELVIVDDCSTDNTVTLIKSYQNDIVKIFTNNENRGHVRTFETALRLAKNDIILLSDQDDIWISGRVSLLLNELLYSRCLLATSNFGLIDESGHLLQDPTVMLLKENSTTSISNYIGILLGKRPYFGCTMALRRDLLKIALPIPSFVESHDIWLALISNALVSNLHVERQTVLRRIHFHNLSPRKRRPAVKLLYSRFNMLLSAATIIFRIFISRINPAGLNRNV